uniref:Uncharacterized protein n=1 Tax=Cucumis melo TaxID=3656 RepID=A0A9I9E2C5_CUCME
MPCNAYRSLLQNWTSVVILILPFVYYHRFEPDMLAFSGFYYGGGKKERREFGAIRRRWKTLHQVSNPDKERRHGKCPPTPEEVCLMLRALGYGQDVYILQFGLN